MMGKFSVSDWVNRMRTSFSGRGTILLVWLWASLGQIAVAQIGSEPLPDHDVRIKRILDAEEINYKIDKDGDFKMVFKVDEERTQAIWVRSRTNTYDQFEIREIFSFGYQNDGPFPEEIANTLLERNWTYKLGAWGRSGPYAVFVVRIAADSDAKALLTAIKMVVRVTDKMEKELEQYTGENDKH